MTNENTREWAIIPEPNSMTVGEGVVSLPYAGRVNESIAIGDGDYLLAHQLVADIRSATGLDWDVATGDMWPGFISLHIADSDASEEAGIPGAYTLTIDIDGIAITGCDFEGVRDGVQTLRQLIRQNGAVLPVLQIEDAPAYRIRGYYLDATRGRVPTLAWLKQWADKLCLYKYNQLQLYIEHTFAFDGMSETWRGSSPLTPADILEFDQYCANLGIELVPSVSTFGHQYVAMRTQELRELGEFPEDADRPFSFIERMRHHTLNVADDRAFAFSTQLVDSYLQLFRTKRFNICADETFDLGKGQSKQEAQRVGVATLYATYVGKLCEHLSQQGREPMFWGDIAIEMPEILETLPNNVTLLNWQYDPEATDEKIQLVAKAGAKQIVCPAVWGWNALLPRIDDAWNNIARIARYGVDCGAEGMLVTDWGDFGHVNDPRMAVPGMIFGAQYAWNPAGDTAESIVKDTDENSAENDLLARVSRVEYGDCSARFVALLRSASAQAVFTWRELVEYLELDDGTGNCNTDVAQTIPCLTERLANQETALTLREARDRMMRNMTTAIERIPQANRKLQQCMVEIAPIMAHTGKSSIAAAVRIAMEGQLLLNRVGFTLADAHGVRDAHDVDDRQPSDYRTLARELECWCEAYAKEWAVTSQPSELHRIQETVWKAADELRRISR
nr:family 20 glycosylhydrolase [Bifidobacterium catenulatum]